MRKISIPSIITQLSVWLTFWGYTLVFFTQKKASGGFLAVLSNPFYWLFNAAFTLLFYFHTYYLIPRFFLEKKFSQYFGALFLVFTAFYLLKPFSLMFMAVLEAVNPLIGYKCLHFDIVGNFSFLLVMVFGFAIQMSKLWRTNEKQKLQAEAGKATAELSFLKAQINPHFLYNTLNNIYALAIDKDQETADSVLRLSNIMRYITDQATEDFVSLKEEVDCISDYIGLQLLHYNNKLKLNFEVNGEIHNKKMAPLILMTYVENVFKYGISSNEPSLITIRLDADDDKITFFSQNKIYPTQVITERTGIGQANTKQRLNHLYPNKHSLDISTENGFYTVNLILQTSNVLRSAMAVSEAY